MGIRFLALVGAMAGLTATAASADPIHLQIAPNSFESEAALVHHVRQSLRGADATIVAVDPVRGTVDLEGSDAAARALRADPAILDVGFIVPATPRLQRVMIEVEGEQISARRVSRDQGFDQVVSGPTGWPGEVLAVEALDARGDIVTTVFVRDPRFVRYEGWNPDGSHVAGSNQAFVDETITFDVILELTDDVESLRVFDRLDTGDEGTTRRDLGRVEIAGSEGDQ